MENTKFVVYALAGVVCLIIAIRAFNRKKRTSEETAAMLHPTPSPAMPAPAPQPYTKKSVAPAFDPEVIKPYIRKLASSVGAIWQIAKNGDPNGMASILFDNLDLTITSINSPELNIRWKEFTNDRKDWTADLYRNKSEQMLQTILDCGVSIPPQTKFVWEERSELFYNAFGPVNIGNECIVLTPYSIYEELVLDKGLATKSNN